MIIVHTTHHRLSSEVVCLHILFLFHDAQVAVDLVDITRDLNETSITAGVQEISSTRLTSCGFPTSSASMLITPWLSTTWEKVRLIIKSAPSNAMLSNDHLHLLGCDRHVHLFRLILNLLGSRHEVFFESSAKVVK